MSEPLLNAVENLIQYFEHEKEEGRTKVHASPRIVKSISSLDVAPPRSATIEEGSAMPKASPPTKPGPKVRSIATPAPETLDKIAETIHNCRSCGLCESRTNTVPGQGASSPELVFIGEGPGAEEDEQGLAFVGRSGHLLTRIIEGMGLTRDEVWIGNIVKCRPPENRTPFPDEMDTCMPYLKQQLANLKPKAIVCLGATAVKGLTKTKIGITRLRGTWLEFEGIPVMPTYHPSYLLRGGGEGKARYWEVWEDMVSVLQKMGKEVPEKKKNSG